MPNTQTTQTSWANDETLRAVRPEVRKILESNAGFRSLPPAEQRQLASTMVKVCSYMANPDGLAARELSKKGGVLALADEDPTEATKRRLSQQPGSTGADFKAGAVTAGVTAFGNMVKTVDFPAFVSGLIQNVFQAIVDSSIKQMNAYGELLANVAKSVDQFAQDNISKNNARDWLAQKYPGQVGVDTTNADSSFAVGDTPAAPTPQLTVTADDASAALTQISSDLGLQKPVTDISDPQEEERLVLGAQLQMARSRQQLLASMVMLGINRIVVTDGLIHAKVVFDMRAQDTQNRRAKASMYDGRHEATASQTNIGFSSWLSPVSADTSMSSSTDHMATVSSSVDDTSASSAAVKANLTGEVRVNFKSDYLPMEKMANPQMISAIQGNAVPVDPKPAAAGAAAGSAAPAKA
ncbi:MAG TPA: hypothetical protein VNY05_22595 [Candidatus Acidoferrales bacterium]|jgi:hypothetical protein|nr:hypothetical protein [Candidatus Acidoferrales bacterium]